MSAEPALRYKPKIALQLALEKSLADRLDLGSLQDGLSQDLGETLNTLGMPGEPLVEVKATQEASRVGGRILSVSIDGRRLVYPSELVRRCHHYVTGDAVDELRPLERIRASLDAMSPQQADAFVRLACAEIIRRSPSAIFTLESAAVTRASLVRAADGASLPDAGRLQALLSPVLDLCISIGDRETVVRLLQEGLRQEKPDAGIREDLIAALRPRVIEVQLPTAYLRQITIDTPVSDRSGFALTRDGLFSELGLRFPALGFVPTEDLRPESFRFKINCLTTLPTRGLQADQYLVNDTPDRLKLLRIEGRSMPNPANQSACSTIRSGDVALAEKAGLTTWSQIDFLVLATSAVLRRHAPYFVDQKEVGTYLAALEPSYPRLVEVARERVAPAVMTETLRLLLAEGISIRGLPQILQVMLDLDHDGPSYTQADAARSAYYRPSEEWFRQPASLACLVRIRMKEHIRDKYTRLLDALVVYLLDAKIEALLTNRSMMSTEAFLAQLEPDDGERILAAVRGELGSLPSLAQDPVVLTTSSVRPVFRQLTAAEFPQLSVLSYRELAPDTTIQPIGRISWIE